ncbi:MAG: hypothetical protein R3E87_22130 [Burkholderiaceae bacterium]
MASKPLPPSTLRAAGRTACRAAAKPLLALLLALSAHAAVAGRPGRDPGCAAPPPAPVRLELITPGTVVKVPRHFVGTHLSLHTPHWKDDGGKPIPPPTYPYGYVRTLSAEVGGLSERAFWSSIETRRGRYDWRAMDQWMAATTGHPVIWTVYGTPSFYQRYPDEPSRWPSWPGIASPPTDAGYAALTRFVAAVARRYGKRIAAFEVWNEPSLPWDGHRKSLMTAGPRPGARPIAPTCRSPSTAAPPQIWPTSPTPCARPRPACPSSARPWSTNGRPTRTPSSAF